MSVNLQLVAFSPQDNPDRLIFEATFSGTYGAGGGTGDTVNFTPYQQTSNPTGFTDPQSIYGQPLFTVPQVPPFVLNEQLLGGYTEWFNGTLLTNGVLRAFNGNGVELTQGAAYPNAYLNGAVYLEVLLPLRTAN